MVWGRANCCCEVKTKERDFINRANTTAHNHRGNCLAACSLSAWPRNSAHAHAEFFATIGAARSMHAACYVPMPPMPPMPPDQSMHPSACPCACVYVWRSHARACASDVCAAAACCTACWHARWCGLEEGSGARHLPTLPPSLISLCTHQRTPVSYLSRWRPRAARVTRCFTCLFMMCTMIDHACCDDAAWRPATVDERASS